MTLVFALEAAFSKCMYWMCLFHSFLATESTHFRLQFLQSSWVFLHHTVFLCNTVIAIKHDFLYILSSGFQHLAREAADVNA